MGHKKIYLLDRYIFKEVARPYIVGVVIITIVMLSNFLYQVADLIIMQDVSFATVLELIVYQLPEIVVETFPVAVLFAIMSGIGRLNREREFTALRMGGFSIYRLVIPLIVFGLLISGTTYLLNENVVPWSNHRARNIILEASLQDVMPDVRENVFFEGPNDRVFYVRDFDKEEEELERVIIFDQKDGQEFPEVITAARGKIIEQEWKLFQGHVHSYDADGRLDTAVDFTEMNFVVEQDMDQFLTRQRTPAEMSREELREEIELFRRSGIDVTSLLVDYHMKIALPLTSLIFVLIGTPLSLGNKDSRALSLALTVVIIFSYYLLVSFARSFGRSGMISPITAAWLPHVVFTILGILLIIFREKWSILLGRFLSKVLLVSLLLLLITGFSFLSFPGALRAEETVEQSSDSLTVRGDYFQYDAATGHAVLGGEVAGEFQEFNFFAEEVIIKGEQGGEEIFKQQDEIEVKESQLSGCELDVPHYYFSSPRLTIYPGDRIVGRHVVFRELDGSLPLFYWPYLVIYLDDREQRLMPEFGYHNQRGYFVRTGYQYLLGGAYPGVLLLDYYTRSGPAGGFRQHLLPPGDRELEFYFFYQEDHEQIDLFDWRSRLDYREEGEVWDSDSWLEYTSFPTYGELEGEIDIRGGPGDHYLGFQGEGLRRRVEEENSVREDLTELSTDIIYTNELPDNIRFSLQYNQDIEPREEEVLTRWGGSMELNRSGDLFDSTFLMERYAPQFPEPEDEDEEDEEEEADEGIRFLRFPELNLDFRRTGPISFKSGLGRYYEYDNDLWGIRWQNEGEYNHSRSLPGPFSLNIRQRFQSDAYHLPYEPAENYWQKARIGHESDFTVQASFWQGGMFEANYGYLGLSGSSPFTFDELEAEEEIRGSFSQEHDYFEFNVSSGYDFLDDRYLDLDLKGELYPLAGLTLSAATYYDINTASWGDLDLDGEYEREPWQISADTSYDLETGLWETTSLQVSYEHRPLTLSTALEYEPQQGGVSRWDSELDLNIEDHLRFRLEKSYDFQDNYFRRAGFEIRRHFHCRSLAFSYDHVEGEYRLEYSLDIFPQQPIAFSSEDDEPFLFNVD